MYATIILFESFTSIVPCVRGLGLIAAAGLIAWGVMGVGRASPSSARSTTRDISHTAAPTASTQSGYYSQVQTPIADLQVRMRVAAFNPVVTSTQRATFQDPDPATWRMLELEMPKSSGGVLDITMLRPLEWLDAHNIVVGGSVALDMPELGAQGNAQVLGVYPCAEIKPGPGQVITATFAHPSTFQVLDVTIGEGDDAETIGVTDNHPFWSETHQAFVPVGQLSVGDELLTLHGQKKRLTALLPRPGPPERVYNLEVHGEHTYYVGHQQLLVHNNYPDEIPWSSPDVRRFSRQIREGLANSLDDVEIVVGSRSQAEELFLRMFQADGYRNTTGWSGEMLEEFGKRGIYHWDEVAEVLKDGSKVLKRHYNDGNLHNYVPHLQIETFDGRKIRILFGKDVRNL
ncbi:MAG: hypothetical protein JNK57_18260 [Planctomycetaceae bacterium]|nr:hypothetical protein [Planctomycetaceae bacterium]